MTDTTISTTVRLVGFHNWPDPTMGREYLGATHRHQFHVTPTVAVGHDNRDVEFHDLRDIVTDWWEEQQGARSCEMMARRLIAHLEDQGLTVVKAEVSEDGEDGATVYNYTPEWAK